MTNSVFNPPIDDRYLEDYIVGSVYEFGSILEDFLGRPIPVTFGDWRPGDQRVYVSDIRKAADVLGWHPATPVSKGLSSLFSWVKNNPGLFESI